MNKIDVAVIRCIDNRNVTKSEIADLANSIKATGLINPITLKPIKKGFYLYDVIAGRKRFQALIKLGYTEIDEKMLTINTKGDPDLIAYEENVTRTNMTLYEEITHLDTLRLKYKDIKHLAEVMHSSVRAINTRLCLLNLNKSWMKALKDNNVKDFTIPMLKIVSQLSEDAQQSCFEISWVKNMKELQAYLLKGVIHKINFANWKGKEGDWFKSCIDCEYNSVNTEYLLDEFKEKDGVCVNKDCWDNKRIAFFNHLLSEYTNLDLKEYHIIHDWGFDADDKALLKKSIEANGGKGKKVIFHERNHVLVKQKVAKKNLNNYHKAFEIPNHYGDDSPRVIYMEKKTSSFVDGEKNEGIEMSEIESLETGLENRKNRHDRKRKRAAIDSLLIALEYTAGHDYQCRFPSDEELFSLITMVGCSDISISEHSGLGELSKELCEKTDRSDVYSLACVGNWIVYHNVINPELKRQLIWHKVSRNLINLLKYGQSGGSEVKWDQAEIISNIIEIDLQQLFNQAIEEIPEPKSWQVLVSKLQKYDAIELIKKDGIYTHEEGFMIPCSVLDAFNVKFKTKTGKVFSGYHIDDDIIECIVVGEKTKDRVIKAINKLTSIADGEVVTMKIKEKLVAYTIEIKAQNDTLFFESWGKASTHYYLENTKKEGNENEKENN